MTAIRRTISAISGKGVIEHNRRTYFKDRYIDNYYEKIRTGKQEKTFYEVVFQVGNREDMATAGEYGDLAKEILDKF